MFYGSYLKLFWYLNSAAFIVEQSSQRYYRAVTIGNDAVISAYRYTFTVSFISYATISLHFSVLDACLFSFDSPTTAVLSLFITQAFRRQE